MVVGAVAGGLGIGAGVGISSVALMPFNTANTFLGSAFFGYGMILGERYMYQADWPKIQQRLENGEKIENIIQEYTGRFTAVVMAEAKIIFNSVTQEMVDIMKAAAGISGVDDTTLTVETEGGTGAAPTPIVDTGESTSIKQDETGTVTTTVTTSKIITVASTSYSAAYSYTPDLINKKGAFLNRIVTLQNRVNLAVTTNTMGNYAKGRNYYWVILELNEITEKYPVEYKQASSAFKYT